MPFGPSGFGAAGDFFSSLRNLKTQKKANQQEYVAKKIGAHQRSLGSLQDSGLRRSSEEHPTSENFNPTFQLYLHDADSTLPVSLTFKSLLEEDPLLLLQKKISNHSFTTYELPFRCKMPKGVVRPGNRINFCGEDKEVGAVSRPPKVKFYRVPKESALDDFPQVVKVSRDKVEAFGSALVAILQRADRAIQSEELEIEYLQKIAAQACRFFVRIVAVEYTLGMMSITEKLCMEQMIFVDPKFPGECLESLDMYYALDASTHYLPGLTPALDSKPRISEGLYKAIFAWKNDIILDIKQAFTFLEQFKLQYKDYKPENISLYYSADCDRVAAKLCDTPPLFSQAYTNVAIKKTFNEGISCGTNGYRLFDRDHSWGQLRYSARFGYLKTQLEIKMQHFLTKSDSDYLESYYRANRSAIQPNSMFKAFSTAIDESGSVCLNLPHLGTGS